MKLKKYIALGVIMAAIGCSQDESLYPLPYDDRDTGGYLRNYVITSNVWDINDLTNSAFEIVFESVDKNYGADLQTIEFYATHRGTTGLITDEVLVKSMDASSFSKVPEPTYSEYLRSSPIRITAAETVAALSTLTTDPDGLLGDPNCNGIFPKVCPAVAFPGSLANGDQVIFRWKMIMKDGRAFTVFNPQNAASPSLGNPNEANITPNITGGQFYSATHTWTVLVRSTLAAAVPNNPSAYSGSYRMSQVALWSPYHSVAQHESFYPSSMNEFLFGNSAADSSQTVSLELVPGGLPTERRFTCKYRGQNITLKINLESGVINQTGAGLTGANGTAAINTLIGLGMTGATNTNLGTVFVPLQNTGLNCTSERQFYVQTPLGGVFNPPGATFVVLPWGMPRSTYPNRGFYRLDQDGLTPGQVMTVALDDDVDEYGRRNGYCWWYRRVYLTLTKL